MTGWDGKVALAYAAEELLFAAQALTADLLSQERGLHLAHSHLHVLAEHERFLPADLARQIAALDARYTDRENSGATDSASAAALTGATFAVLGEVQHRLSVCQLNGAA